MKKNKLLTRTFENYGVGNVTERAPLAPLLFGATGIVLGVVAHTEGNNGHSSLGMALMSAVFLISSIWLFVRARRMGFNGRGGRQLSAGKKRFRLIVIDVKLAEVDHKNRILHRSI